MVIEPVPNEPAAVVDAGERILVVADYHAGFEAELRADGIEIPSRADERREHLLALLERTDPDRVLFLGDLSTAIGKPGREEGEELAALLDAVTPLAPVTVVKGNHDGGIEDLPAVTDLDLTVSDTDGIRLGDVGFTHGHTWPSPDVLGGTAVCTAHEHPMVRMVDEVGGSHVERVWLRGGIDPTPFEDFHDRSCSVGDELVVFPAFNRLVGGTWVNADREFLSPFLPQALENGEAYLLDGTRLGPYADVTDGPR